jgi:hypothetical protein
MVQQLFGILFGVSLVALVLAVPVGLVLLAWPRRTGRRRLRLRTARRCTPDGFPARQFAGAQ